VVNVGSVAFAHFARIFQRQGLDDQARAVKWLGTRVVCVRDLDLWPEAARKAEDNPYGFEVPQAGNQHYWESHYADNPQGRANWIAKPTGRSSCVSGRHETR
jgi:putative ATP-dependent endonuclease of OLD family